MQLPFTAFAEHSGAEAKHSCLDLFVVRMPSFPLGADGDNCQPLLLRGVPPGVIVEELVLAEATIPPLRPLSPVLPCPFPGVEDNLGKMRVDEYKFFTAQPLDTWRSFLSALVFQSSQWTFCVGRHVPPRYGARWCSARPELLLH